MRTTVHRLCCVASAVLACALSLHTGVVRADVVAVVSAKSEITTLTKTQVLDIFLGKRTRFPDGSPAIPIDQAEGSAARAEFYTWLVAMSPAQLKTFLGRGIIFTGRGQLPKTVATGQEAMKLLIAEPNTIGYIEQSLRTTASVWCLR